jgi:tetratricopeptide (TPR) repeat protein
MAEERIFVGRKDELEQFSKVLEDPKGQAVIVVGQAGMGKTWLAHKMAEVAENHPDLKCGWVRYEVTPTDSVDSTMALMMDNAFEAASTEPGSFDKVPQRIQQWKALLNVIKIGDLVMSLRRDPQRNTREQFLSRLGLISKRMPENGRAVFIIDPEKYMQKESDQSWAIVVKQLPEKIKFVFAQRPGDVLVGSETFDALDNVVCVPGERLDVLEEEAVDELLTQRIKGIKYTVTEVREVLSRYEGHPYALGAALDLIEGGIELEELPEKPEPTQFAAVQWNKVSNISEDAIGLFKAYAILEVGVPDDVVEAVSKIDSNTRLHLVADKYLCGLLREEGEGLRIYHAILADYIVGQIGEGERKEYHGRAVEVYREKLAEAKKAQTKPDVLAAIRLPEHVLAAEGKKAFVYAFVNECTQPLVNIGLLDAAIAFSERALKVVEKGAEEEASVRSNLGIVYRMRGDLDKAGEMHERALEIYKKIGHKEGMTASYGNLGVIYEMRDDLDKAEEMTHKGLKIDEKLGRIEGMAAKYNNLGMIYFKRGDLDKAEDMHKRALEIDKQKANKKGIASAYGNLGVIYRNRGELDKAQEMFLKGLEIDGKLGRLEGMAAKYSNLGVVYLKRGDLDKAEEMHKKSLEIREKLGLQEGIANSYSNLGGIYQQRGDIEKSREYGEKAVELYKRIGMPHMVEKVEAWLKEIN